MSVLLIAEHNNKEVKPFTYNAITAASQIDQDLHVLVIGYNADEVAKSISQVPSVKKVIQVDNEIYENYIAENFTSAIIKQADNYSHIVCSANTFGKNVMPRVSAVLDVQQISDISAVIDDKTFERPIYAGNAIATVESVDEKKIITVRATAFDAAAAEGGSAEVVKIDASGESGLSSYVGSELSKSERPELTAADIIISGGRGMQSGDNFAMLEKVADKLEAGKNINSIKVIPLKKYNPLNSIFLLYLSPK